MSFVDHPPDWLEKLGEGLSEFFHLEAGPPKPKANQQHNPHPDHKDDARGLVLPGYNYLGPGNGLDRGEPVNEADAAAREHDEAYQALLDAGDNPYLKYNHADAAFQARLQGDESFGGNLGRAAFQAKKRLLEPFGLVEGEPALPDKTEGAAGGQGRVDDYYPKRKKARAGETKGPSKDAAQSGSAGEGSSQQLQIPAPPSGVGSGTMSAGGGAPMGDDQQGADGVGNASGDWHCDSTWLGDRVVTKSTRTWALPSYNNHLYKEIHGIDGTTDGPNAYFGYSTPWGYFDFNRFHCHWSPRDWQRLVNNYWGFRPKAMRVKLFNIQVKEVTTENNVTTIANNLTSTVQVFADAEYQLPYVMGSGSEGAMPAFPPQVYTLPQYGYATVNRRNKNTPNDRSSFYCLEYFPSKMLRTGNNFEFVFEFEDVPFHTSFAPAQNLFKLNNPLVDQYLYRFAKTDNAGNVRFKKIPGNKFGDTYKNWFPGNFYRTQGWNVTGANKVIADSHVAANKIRLDDVNYECQPMPHGMANNLEGENKYALQNTLVFNHQPQPNGSTAEYPPENVLVTSESETVPVNQFACEVGGEVTNSVQDPNRNPSTTTYNMREIMPGSIWMDRDVYLQGPIWAKIPDTGASFHPAPAMGGFGLKRPPPMVLIKNTPVPAQVVTFTEIPINSFITQYSTGQVTVEMEWELKKETSKRWNPEMQYTNNYNNPTFVDFAPDNTGQYRTTRAIGTRYLTRPL